MRIAIILGGQLKDKFIMIEEITYGIVSRVELFSKYLTLVRIVNEDGIDELQVHRQIWGNIVGTYVKFSESRNGLLTKTLNQELEGEKFLYKTSLPVLMAEEIKRRHRKHKINARYQ